MTRPRSQAGFTLVELMVALVAGVIAITTIYFVGAASSRHFHEQQRVAQTQMSLRMAMEQLRRDIQRAGFLGHANSRTAQRCWSTGNVEVQAVHFQPGQDTAILPNASENGVVADRLTLTGNYATSDGYLATGLDAGGTSLRLQSRWQSFRRDFGGALPGQELVDGAEFDAELFTAVFRQGRVLHLTNQLGNHFFVPIAGADANARVNLQTALPVGGQCVGGLADGALVAPLSRIEYAVRDLTAEATGSALLPADGARAEEGDVRGLANAQLIRREVDADGNVMLDENGFPLERIVLEYVANVSYRFVMNQAPPGQPPDLIVGGAEHPQIVQWLDDVRTSAVPQPQRLRSVIVTLSARTAEQDPRFPWVPDAAGDPARGIAPTRYRVNTNLPGAARVRTLTSEIFLPNVQP